jgi:spermidine synthase
MAYAIFVVAFATLVFELALIRVLSFTIWHHFAYVVLSMALLGFGASGSVVAVWPRIGARDVERAIARSSMIAGVLALVVLAFFAFVPVDPLAAANVPGQLALLVVYQIAAALPFLFAGLSVNLILRARAVDVHRLYFWDLLGAGLGCGAAVLLMSVLTPPGAVTFAAAAFIAAGAPLFRAKNSRMLALLSSLAVAVVAPFADALPYYPAHTKHVHGAIAGMHMQPKWTHWSALFRTDLLERTEGTRHDPSDSWGLSPIATEVQPFWGLVMHDGSAGTPVFDLREGRLDDLENHILALPYRIVSPTPDVLVIGVGGGRDVIAARRFGARHVTGVELDPATIRIVKDVLAPQYGDFFKTPEVRLVAGEGRHFVRRSTDRYDLIQLTGVDTVTAAASGAYVLSENYLYTVEAVQELLGALEPGGLVSFAVGHWSTDRPQVAGRILTVATEALRSRGVARPEAHVALVNSRTLFVNLIVKNEPLSAREIEVLAKEAERLEFEVLVLDGLGHPTYEELARLEGEKLEEKIAALPFDVTAVRDDNPFFFNFYRFRNILDAEDLNPNLATALGQLVLAILLGSATALAVLIIVAPLLIRRGWSAVRSPGAAGLLGYFLAVGTGFMLFEVSLLQRFVIYLGYPTYSLSVVLCTLLISMGFGSRLSERWTGSERSAVAIGVLLVAAIAAGYGAFLGPIQEATLGLPLAARVGVTVALLGPLGIILGHFFPLGIRRVHAIHPDMVSWGWAINGCSSVVATIGAVMLAMTFGFSIVWATAVGIYLLGAIAFWVSDRRIVAA